MSRVAEVAGIFLGAAAGVLALSWWKASRKPKDNKETDTGEKTPDGKPIIQVTGVGGADGGKKVRGYKLPSKIEEVKLPITVIVKPNRDLFLDFTIGQKVKLTERLSDELIFKGKAGGGVEGAYYIWYPQLQEKVLGAID